MKMPKIDFLNSFRGLGANQADDQIQPQNFSSKSIQRRPKSKKELYRDYFGQCFQCQNGVTAIQEWDQEYE